jgi:acetyl-CoA synthetase
MRPVIGNDYRSCAPGEVIVLDRRASRSSGGEDGSRGPRGLSTARAVLKVLSFLAQHPEGVSAREVATELGKSVSTAYYLLASLHEEGFTLHEPGRGYRLSAKASIDPQASEASPASALPRAVAELFARTHRRSYLGRVEAGAIVITTVRGRQGIPRVPGLGPRISRNAHALAMGKVVLSLLPEHGRRRYIERGLRTYTPRTITSARALMAELDHVRKSGFAVDRGEFDPEYCSIAAPIVDEHNRFLAVLGLSTPSRTFQTEAHELVAGVREVARGASRSQQRTRSEDQLRSPRVPPRRAA